MNRWIRTVLIGVVCQSALAASAHEFWLLPQTFSPAPGSTIPFTLNVGENFQSQLVGWSKSTVTSLRSYHAGKTEELQDRLGSVPVGAVETGFRRAGTYVVAMDSAPSRIELPAEKFHAYLHDEGLDMIIKQRESSGTASLPGRERYRRNVKTLLRVGAVTDASYSMATEQRLEIIPLTNLFSDALNTDQRFSIRFDSKPLANALVKGWHHHNGQLVIVKRRTDANGNLVLSFPYSGTWMLSVVHMLPATDTPDVDWDSYWGNLTFELARK